MDELTARFELVKAEMAELQAAIRHYDTILLQIKGWAVTLGSAAAGLSVTVESPLLVLLGVFSSAAFCAIDAGRRSVQRLLIERALLIEDALNSSTVSVALGEGSDLRVPGLGRHVQRSGGAPRTRGLGRALVEMRRPSTWSLYGAMAATLAVVGVLGPRAG